MADSELANLDIALVAMELRAMCVVAQLGNHAVGRRRARGLSGHVVVVGFGSFGIRVAGALVNAGADVVVVERTAPGQVAGPVLPVGHGGFPGSNRL